MATSELITLGKSYLQIRNYDKAMEYLSQAVMQGKNGAAQGLYQVGNHFLKEKEYAKAEKAFQILADRGHSESCLALGQMCQKGLGRKKDMEAAFGYFGEAFRNGLAMGAYQAGLLMMSDALQYEEVRDIALTWFQEAIQGGIYQAYMQIGYLYSEHTTFQYNGTTRNDAIALSWFLRGALHGDGGCMEQSALYFLQGYGTKRDVKRAVKLFKQAAAKGESFSCMQLARMYEKGEGVRTDSDQAIHWYLKAQECGAATGQYEAGRVTFDLAEKCLLSGDDKEEAVSLFQKAADYGYFIAYLELADIAMREGDISSYRNYLKKGTQAGDADCRGALIDWYKGKIKPYMDDLEPLARKVDKDPQHRNKKLWKQFVTLLENMEQVLLEGVEDTNDENMWRLLAIWYLQHGEDFGKKGKDFLNAANHLMEINESEELLVLLWFYYSGNSATWAGALHGENPRKAAYYARKLAKRGANGFCHILASYYREGYGVKQNLKKAGQLERKETL